MTEPRILSLPLSKIRLDGGTQIRVRLDQSVVNDYEAAIRKCHELKLDYPFPPVIVFFADLVYWLADGFHRVQANRQITPRGYITCEVRAGTLRDAILFAVGCNAVHGLRRSNEDKRNAVRTILADKEWGRWSHTRIAETCGVSDMLVADVKEEMIAESSPRATRHLQESWRCARRGGTEYRIEVQDIGARAAGEGKATAEAGRITQQLHLLERCLELARRGGAKERAVIPMYEAICERLRA